VCALAKLTATQTAARSKEAEPDGTSGHWFFRLNLLDTNCIVESLSFALLLAQQARPTFIASFGRHRSREQSYARSFRQPAADDYQLNN
jgi:hypothetical protein